MRCNMSLPLSSGSKNNAGDVPLTYTSLPQPSIACLPLSSFQSRGPGWTEQYRQASPIGPQTLGGTAAIGEATGGENSSRDNAHQFKRKPKDTKRKT